MNEPTLISCLDSMVIQAKMKKDVSHYFKSYSTLFTEKLILEFIMYAVKNDINIEYILENIIHSRISFKVKEEIFNIFFEYNKISFCLYFINDFKKRSLFKDDSFFDKELYHNLSRKRKKSYLTLCKPLLSEKTYNFHKSYMYKAVLTY